jgi:hypothetical protein
MGTGKGHGEWTHALQGRGSSVNVDGVGVWGVYARTPTHAVWCCLTLSGVCTSTYVLWILTTTCNVGGHRKWLVQLRLRRAACSETPG